MKARILILTLLSLSPSVDAYVGPGAGLGMIGSLIAIIVALVLALVGVLLLPIKLLRARKRRQSAEPPSNDTHNPTP
ncbi:MAG: hypothetical protein H6981_08425 [Gammaproteobacteria bacterium]|nr:hypothetical protein [Gammaproteobacteria bacterium]MCP5136812.1 hypothetical protein [Gammaproteobacteria bacterium]